MDHGACNVIYLDRRANDEHIRRDAFSASLVAVNTTDGRPSNLKSSAPEVRDNVDALLTFFNEVHVCGSGSSCLSKISHLHRGEGDTTPTLVLIDIPYDEEQRLRRLSREPRAPSPTSTRKPAPDSGEPDDIYGMHLLLHLASEIQQKSYSKLLVPVVLLSGFDKEWPGKGVNSPNMQSPSVLTDTVRLVKYLDAGAVDVYTSPLSRTHVNGLAVHAYRIYREVTKEESSFLLTKRNRKLSWVGVEEQKPYAYLREAMVSGLMGKICNPETLVETYDPSDMEVEEDRKVAVAAAIGSWCFSAHEFTDDELLYASLLMLQHALQMPELEKWRLNTAQLVTFLLASRAAYTEFVLYHNFRHVADVLQALFYFLLKIGILPPYPTPGAASEAPRRSAVASLLKPFDALTLLISAIGHDVGHPGVNNAFLVALNSPLAQLYNDRSVLESFHCAAYSQILRRFWPGAFSDIIMRKLMINSILATDMGLHFKYMADLGNFQEKLADNKNTTEGWSPKTCDDYKDLLCGLLIKCADISNVARKFETASRWAHILTDEFSNQGTMEQELQMPTCLFGGPPILDNMIKMGESQIGFMNIFARPLFEAVADVLPSMRFSVDEILRNKAVWERTIEKEKESGQRAQAGLLGAPVVNDATPSRHTRSNEHLREVATKGQPPPTSVPTPVQKPPAPPAPHTPPGASVTGSSRPSSGSGAFQFTGPASSGRSSLGGASASDEESRNSSTTDMPSPRQAQVEAMQQSSPRSNGETAITTIVVTQSPPTPERQDNKKPREPGCASPLRSLSPKKSGSPKKLDKAYGDHEDDAPPRPTTAPSPPRNWIGPDSHDMANYPLSPPRPMQPDFDSPTHLFHHVSSESDLAHVANGTVDGTVASRTLRAWELEQRKRSDDSGVSPQDQSLESRWDHNRLGHTNSRGSSQRWKSSGWRRDRSTGDLTEEKIPNRDEKGGYLPSITPNTSLQPSHQDRSKSGRFAKFWRKLKPNGDRQIEAEIISRSPREEV